MLLIAKILTIWLQSQDVEFGDQSYKKRKNLVNCKKLKIK